MNRTPHNLPGLRTLARNERAVTVTANRAKVPATLHRMARMTERYVSQRVVFLYEYGDRFGSEATITEIDGNSVRLRFLDGHIYWCLSTQVRPSL